jgi:sugar lactone lactonase YvrE
VTPWERDTYRVICKGAVELSLADGFCFGEGPRWFEGLLWFSDMLGEAVHTVNLHGDMTTLRLPGHAPSGLGFRPDGTLLIVSTENRQLLRYDGDTVATLADLSQTAPASLGDMVVDDLGRAYVGSQAFEGGVIVRIDPDGTSTVVAGDLDFPNGMVITADHTMLIVAESVGRRLSAFTIAADGALTDRRVFADGLGGPPDGICPRRCRRRLDVDDVGQPVRPDRRGRCRHRPDRDRRPHRDRLRSAVPRAARCSCCPAPAPTRSGLPAPSCPASMR